MQSKYAKFWDGMFKLALVLIPISITYNVWITRTLFHHESRIHSFETWRTDGAVKDHAALKNDILKEVAADTKLQLTESERRYESLRTSIETTQRELIQLRAVTETQMREIQSSQARILKLLETR